MLWITCAAAWEDFLFQFTPLHERQQVTFSVPVVQESDGDTAQVMGVPLTEGDVQHIFSIMQMNAEEAAKAVKDVKNENVLIVLHAADSRNTVKKAAKSQAEALEPAER